MCVVSMVTEHFHQKWPTYPPHPNTLPSTPALPTPAEYFDFLELVRKAREYDMRTNQPDCPDAEKLKWMDELEQRMVKKYNLQPKYTPENPIGPTGIE